MDAVSQCRDVDLAAAGSCGNTRIKPVFFIVQAIPDRAAAEVRNSASRSGVIVRDSFPFKQHRVRVGVGSRLNRNRRSLGRRDRIREADALHRRGRRLVGITGSIGRDHAHIIIQIARVLTPGVGIGKSRDHRKLRAAALGMESERAAVDFFLRRPKPVAFCGP